MASFITIRYLMPALRIRYQTVEFDKTDIHLRTLRDRQQFSDESGVAQKLGISSAMWPIFGIVWPSSLVLAHFLFDFKFKNKRVLEVGCGIGLTSLLLNHLLVDITATDQHPEAEHFLKKNTSLNKDQAIPFVRTGWDDIASNLGTFDLIVGSDLLYEDEHVESLSNFIDQHARASCEVIIVDPGRGRQGRFNKKMVMLGYTHSESKPEETRYLDKPFKGKVLRYSRKA